MWCTLIISVVAPVCNVTIMLVHVWVISYGPLYGVSCLFSWLFFKKSKVLVIINTSANYLIVL